MNRMTNRRHAPERERPLEAPQTLLGWPLGRTLHAAPSREHALCWEARHFAPGGPGWKRLRKRRRVSQMS